MKKVLLAAIIAIASLISFRASAQSVVHISWSGGAGATTTVLITYSSNWTGSNGSTNPDLALNLKVTFASGKVDYFDPIANFIYFNASGQPIYTASFDEPSELFIRNISVVSSVPIY